MTKNDLPKSSQELITRFLPEYEQPEDVNEKQFQEALMNFHLAMMGKTEKRVYTPVFSCCSGTLNS